jgi:hypothetical protein
VVIDRANTSPAALLNFISIFSSASQYSTARTPLWYILALKFYIVKILQNMDFITFSPVKTVDAIVC